MIEPTFLSSTLSMDQQLQTERTLIEFSPSTAQFILSSRFTAASGHPSLSSSGYGVSYVTELLKRCSECQSRLLALMQFGSGQGIDGVEGVQSTDFHSMLLEPLRSLAKRFHANAMVEVQGSSIVVRGRCSWVVGN